MPRFKAHDLEKVREAVKKFEGATRGELVPLVVPSSANYDWVPYKCGFFGFVFAFASAEVWAILRSWPLDVFELTTVSVLGSILGFGLGWVPWVARRVIGRSRLAESVHQRALSEFTEHGCGHTRERIGVLVMVSLFEHRIEIITDKGIETVVRAKEGPEVWSRITAEFSRTAASGQVVEGLVTVIRQVGEIIVKFFPTEGARENELSDELRTEE